MSLLFAVTGTKSLLLELWSFKFIESIFMTNQSVTLVSNFGLKDYDF